VSYRSKKCCGATYFSIQRFTDGESNEINYNYRIPESRWMTSQKGKLLYKEDCDQSSPTWADLFPDYEFVGWEGNIENDTDEVINLYAIWERK